MTFNIGVIIGSLRKESWNRKLAHALMDLMPPDLKPEMIEIRQLPLYNQDPDDEGNPPKEWVEFREKVKRMDGILFVTPEYNRSVPAPLKNAIDVGSRPYGKSVWNNKPSAIVSASPGSIGGFGSNHHLRQSMVFLNVPCMQQPEAYIANVNKLFSENHTLANADTRDFLKKYVEAYLNWVKLIVNK